jgi:hypothetical protein
MIACAATSQVRVFTTVSHGVQPFWALKLRRLAGVAALITLFFAGISLSAQTVHFSGAIRTLGSGFNAPTGVAVDGSGNVFVADTNNNAVKEMVAASGYTTVETLGSGFNQPNGVAVDSIGDVFVADTVNNAVKEILAAGGYTTVNSLGSGFHNPTGVAVDGSGNVFVADFYSNAVKEILAVGGKIPASPTINTLGSGFNEPSGVALDGSGNVYVADTANSAVKEILAAGGYTTVKTLGSGFSYPRGVAVDGSGNVFVADTSGNAAKEVLAAGGYTTVKTLGGGFGIPYGVAVDGSGGIFVADSGHNAVKEILASGNLGSVKVGSTSTTPLTLYFTFDAGGSIAAPAVRTQGTAGLDFTDAGTGTCTTNGTTHTYAVGDTCTVDVTFKPTHPGPRYGAVELFGSSGRLLATGYVLGSGVGPQLTFANTTTGVYLPSAQKILGSGFDRPYGVAVDGHGNVFISDTYNNAVKEVVAAGGYTTVKILGSEFSFPTGLAVDGSGNLFLADTDNNAVEELVAAGGYTTIKTLGSGFSRPADVAVDGSGNVFVADENNSAVKEILAAGGYTTVNTLGSGFDYPSGVAVDESGNVFVADTYNDAVKEILAAGGYTTINILGSGFHRPAGVALDGNGNVFVADFDNNAVKEIMAAGGYTTVEVLGSGFNQPQGVALDGNGNVFVANLADSTVSKLDFAAPPSLSFANTMVGSQSSDSPQIVTVSNNGNADLMFPIPASGNNPSLAAGFKLDAATTCPQLNTSSSAGTLPAGTNCDYAADFIPKAPGGAESGSLKLTDNNLNAGLPSYATQSIGLAGTAPIIPAITWAPPAAITYGTALSATQLDATSTVAGTFTYTPAAGTVLGAGAQTLSVTLAPTDTIHYTSATKTVSLTVKKAIPVITWTAPAAVTYGTALSATQQNAASSVAGTFVYSPASGTVLAAGNHTLWVTFTPTDTADYAAKTVSVTLTVNKAVLKITAKNASRTYGAVNPTFIDTITGFVLGQGVGALSGTASLTTSATTTSPAGAYSIVAAQGSLAAANYTFTFVNGTLTVNKAAPSVTWTTPAAITYGTVLSAAQQNAKSSVAGTFVYAPVSGTSLAAGTHTLWVTFTPTDTTDYATRVVSVTLTVNRAVLTVTANKASRIYGAANPTFTGTITGFVLGQTKGVLSGAASLTTTATTTSPVGTYSIAAAQGTLAAVNYTFTFVNGTLTVNKATPAVAWAAPAPITYGTALGAAQQNASSSVAGTFAYAPPSGTLLAAGSHTLWVTFTPTDSTDYTTRIVSVTLTVSKAVLTVTANNASRAAGAANPTLTDTITGFVLGQSKGVLSGAASLTTTATTSSPAGTYPIVAAQGTLAAANYTFRFVNGTLTVN